MGEVRMGTLIIYGASDDLVEFEGHADGEVGCYDRTVTVCIGDDDRAFDAILRHDGRIGWVVGVSMPSQHAVDEDRWNPPPVTITTANDARRNTPYSPMLTVELPAGCPVRCFVGDEEREIR